MGYIQRKFIQVSHHAKRPINLSVAAPASAPAFPALEQRPIIDPRMDSAIAQQPPPSDHIKSAASKLFFGVEYTKARALFPS